MNLWLWVAIGTAAYLAMGVLTTALCIFLSGRNNEKLTAGEVLVALVFWFVVLPLILSVGLAFGIAAAMTACFRGKAAGKPAAWEEEADV
jgi:low temperature requirement protein LtrA